MVARITLVKVRRIPDQNVNQDLQWLGTSLGLFNLRDRSSSCFRVFITLVKKSRGNESLSSDEIADKLHLSRGTVVHHLVKLMESGIVVKEQQGYILRESNLQKLIHDLQRDMDSLFTELKEVADDIDGKLG
ncbi:MAG TPA: ArsR family transcriptional regulator [Candidatus Nanoarchaeia archaeon]|nr:ArsR family transcriptional regulator [Candidatus Nanoarchaeia archaeon]